MKKFFFLISILLFTYLFNAQIKNSSIAYIDETIEETAKIDFSHEKNPAEILDKLLQVYRLAKNEKYEKGMLEIGNYIIYIYYRQSQYEKVIQFGLDLENDMDLKNSTNFYSISTFHRFLALSYRKLKFDEEGEKEIQKAFISAKKIKDKEELHMFLALIYKDKASYFSEIHQYPDSVGYYLFKSLKEIESITDKQKLKRFSNKIFIYNSIAVYYLKVAQPRDTVMAKKYFSKVEQIYESSHPPMLYINEIEILLTLSDFYLADKDYNKAINFTKKALELENQHHLNAYKKKRMYEILTKAYLETGDNKQSKKYLDLFTKISDSIAAEMNNIDTPLKKIIAKNKKINAQDTQKILLFIALGILIISILVYIKIKKNQKKTHENYKKIIARLVEDKENEKNNIPSEPEEVKIKVNTKISNETSNQLLVKLNKFEQSNGFLKKDLSLSSLAHNLNTNPKYLSEIIKENKSESFNNYINKLRINYITKKLYEFPIYRQYKIKYLAEECGYASHQVFIIAFKKENGVTPSYYIEQLKKEADIPVVSV